jgi:hypothetical protein
VNAKARNVGPLVELTWASVPAGTDGFVMYRDGKRVAHSLDPTLRKTRFLRLPGKHVYGVAPIAIGQPTMVTVAGGTPSPSPPPPKPPPGPNLALAQSWIFMGQQPNNCLIYPSYYGVAFTADRAYERPTPALIQQLRSRGQRIRSWCDCHTTFPDEAKAMAQQLGLDGWIGEGESSAAFRTAVNAGAQIIVGNLSALTDEDRNDIRTGRVLFINELYLNQDPGRADRENWMNLPVAGRCIACYDARGEASTGVSHYPVSQYLAIGKFQPHRDSMYDPSASDDDRRALP